MDFSRKIPTYTTEHHFSDRRFALLFAPGIYDVDFEVGYYVQVLGLGKSPDDVVFMDCVNGPYVPALNRHIHNHGLSLDTFWRSAENFASHATNGMKWSVSQAAPLRRVHVTNDLYLHDGPAYASGGHLANSVVDGQVHFGGQQQYLCRNVKLGKGVTGGAWSLVFVGCDGDVPASSVGSETTPSITVIEDPGIQIEKPYVSLDGEEMYQLRVPRPRIRSLGAELEDDARDFSNVRVVGADEEDATNRIQEALEEGKDVVLAPGIFHLNRTLVIGKENQVLLGLGLATLVSPPDGAPCLNVKPRISGVRVAGIMLEASKNLTREATFTSTLLEWGEDGIEDGGSPQNPGAMFDIFCRVGGGAGDRSSIAVETMMRVYSGNVVGDNLWLWRADHSELGTGELSNFPHISPIFHQNEEHENRVDTGIEVLGDNVTFFGLAVEHANGHQTVWRGENGSVFFYQCELPYDVGQEFGRREYRGYLVDKDVNQHELYGAGVYSNFRKEYVDVSTAIEYPEGDDKNIQIISPFTVHLDQYGGIASVANGKGRRANRKGSPVRLA